MTFSKSEELTSSAIRTKLRLDSSSAPTSAPTTPNPDVSAPMRERFPHGSLPPGSQQLGTQQSIPQQQPNAQKPSPKELPKEPPAESNGLGIVEAAPEILVPTRSSPPKRMDSKTVPIRQASMPVPEIDPGPGVQSSDALQPSAKARDVVTSPIADSSIAQRDQAEAFARAKAQAEADHLRAANDGMERRRVEQEEVERRQAAERLRREEQRRAEAVEREERERTEAIRLREEEQARIAAEKLVVFRTTFLQQLTFCLRRAEKDRIEQARLDKLRREEEERSRKELAKKQDRDNLRNRFVELRQTGGVMLRGHISVQGGSSMVGQACVSRDCAHREFSFGKGDGLN